MSRKKVKITDGAKRRNSLSDTLAINCESVTAFRVPGSLLAKSAIVKIEEGMVVEIVDLSPAENTHNNVISKAVREIWKIIRRQNTDTFLGNQ